MKLTGYQKLVVETLVVDGLLSPEQAQEVERTLGERVVRLDSLLVNSGLVTRDDLMDVLSRKYGLPWVDPRALPTNEVAGSCQEFKIWNYKVRGAADEEPDQPSHDEEISRHYRVLPIGRHGATWVIALPAPQHLDLIDRLKFMTGYMIEAQLAFSDDLLWAMKEFRHMSFEDPWFDDIDHVVRTDLHKARFEDRWGFVRNDGGIVIEPRFEEVRDFREEGTAMVREGGTWGAIDSSGAYVSAVRFDEISSFEFEKISPVRIGDKWGYKNLAGVIHIEARFDSANEFVNGLAGVKKGDAWGFIRPDGSFAVESRFDEVDGFYLNEASTVKVGRKWGLIDRAGNFIIDPKYDDISRNTNGRGTVSDEGKWGFLKDDRVFCEPRFDDIRSIGEGFTAVISDGKWGFLDWETEMITEPRYKVVGIFNGGVAPCWNGDAFGFVDRAGREIVELKYQKVMSFSDGMGPVKRGGLWGFVDRTGREVIPPRFGNVDRFNEGMAAVALDGLWGFIDTSGRFVIEPQYDDARSFHKGRARVNILFETNYKYIDKTGNFVPFEAGDVDDD